MNYARWINATALVEAIHQAENRAEDVRQDGLQLRRLDISNTTEAEARAISSGLEILRVKAAQIAEREASS